MAAPGEINIATLGGGVAVARFEEELRRTVANILDPNTSAKAKRSVVLTVTISPAADRTFGEVEVSCDAKLAPVTAFGTRAFFGRTKEGEVRAYEDNPRQVTIEQFVEAHQAVPSIAPVSPDGMVRVVSAVAGAEVGGGAGMTDRVYLPEVDGKEVPFTAAK